MTENTNQYTGAGTEGDPLTFNVRTPAPDPVKEAIASLPDIARHHEAAFRSAADLSANLPADLREIVSEASNAITAPIGMAAQARVKAEEFRANVTLYPEGREFMASEAIKAGADKVSESFASADVRLKVAEASLYEAARPSISADAAMPARADLQMMTQRHIDNPTGLANTLKNLAQRGDAVGALVADSTYLGDFLDAQGVERELRDAILTTVRAEVVKTAAQSGDAKRAAAGKTSLALAELKRARAAAASYTRHTLSSKR
ncbi:hypothetical protein OG784_18765 [Streptomyces sp. NBC_01617]|uniref:hypothetical protein n=1 Tax=Streptomyces sp. NBC_01617 TaxID=2975899 RepID=UPI003870C0B5|nr:hypothetical protein OG784_18765 [Streptomyces sp. NBC_01617]